MEETKKKEEEAKTAYEAAKKAKTEADEAKTEAEKKQTEAKKAYDDAKKEYDDLPKPTRKKYKSNLKKAYRKNTIDNKDFYSSDVSNYKKMTETPIYRKDKTSVNRMDH